MSKPEKNEHEFTNYYNLNEVSVEDVVKDIGEELDYVPYDQLKPGTKMPDGTYFLGIMDGNTTAEDVHNMAQLAIECQDKWYAEHGVEVDEDGEPVDPDWEAKLREREPDIVLF